MLQQYSEDPTVNRLQALAADMLGMEAAILVTSGTMGNLTSILAHCMERGSEVCCSSKPCSMIVYNQSSVNSMAHASK